MRGAHAHAHRIDTPPAQSDELLRDEANGPTVEQPPEGAEALSLPKPHDDLNAVRGILFSCAIGACLWLLIAMFAISAV